MGYRYALKWKRLAFQRKKNRTFKELMDASNKYAEKTPIPYQANLRAQSQASHSRVAKSPVERASSGPIRAPVVHSQGQPSYSLSHTPVNAPDVTRSEHHPLMITLSFYSFENPVLLVL